jgi:membrane-anchored protein YejM (alkaline phosphatase superfamily)
VLKVFLLLKISPANSLFLNEIIIKNRMETASLSDIKKELSTLELERILDLSLRLAKYKKENKELLSYLLFNAHDEQGFIKSIKNEIDEQLKEINRSNLYYVKKSLRKILRTANKYIKYSGIKQTEIELRLYFCKQVKDSRIPIQSSVAIINIYNNQIKKIRKVIALLHEDLQYDYSKELEPLIIF